jgi:hypothetical protein
VVNPLKTNFVRLEDILKNSLRLIAVATSLLSALLILTAALNAQVLEKSPISGGVLAARAYRAGLLKPMSTNTLVPGGDSLSCSPAPCILPNVQASGGGQPVNEDPVAVNLKNPNQVLTGGNDYNCPNIQGFYSSNDGGSTWTRTCLPGSNGEGDPIVGYDLKNVAYAGGVQGSDVVLSSSTNNGQSWSTPVVVTTPLLGSLADKPWLEVDTNPGSPLVNSLYVSVTQFDGASDSEISVSHSRDGGKTWATVAVDTKQTYPNEVDQFSDLAIGADGAVYVSWLRCPANGATGDCGGTVSKILLSKSTDGGNTWSAPVTVSTPTLVPDNCGAFYGCLPNTGERVSNIAANAVFGKGATAKVYLCVYTWSGSQMQVEVSTSNDGGNTFGAPVRVSNSNKGDQFFQWINPAQNGGIAVTWLDRRNDSGNLKYQPMVAISTNGGASFSATHPLSSTMSNPDDDGFGGSFMGDYRCHVFNGATMYAVWEDMRTGTSQDEVGGVKFR